MTHLSYFNQAFGSCDISNHLIIYFEISLIFLRSKNKWPIDSSSLLHNIQSLSCITLNIFILFFVTIIPWHASHNVNIALGLAVLPLSRYLHGTLLLASTNPSCNAFIVNFLLLSIESRVCCT